MPLLILRDSGSSFPKPLRLAARSFASCRILGEGEIPEDPLPPPGALILRSHDGASLLATGSGEESLWVVEFRGREAHGAFPWLGRDASAAAELLLHALTLAHPKTPLSPLLTLHGEEGTVSPRATLFLRVPARRKERFAEEILRALAMGCARATGTILGSLGLQERVLSLRPDLPLAERVRRAFARQGLPLLEGPVPPTPLGTLSRRTPLGVVLLDRRLPTGRLRPLIRDLAGAGETP